MSCRRASCPWLLAPIMTHWATATEMAVAALVHATMCGTDYALTGPAAAEIDLWWPIRVGSEKLTREQAHARIIDLTAQLRETEADAVVTADIGAHDITLSAAEAGPYITRQAAENHRLETRVDVATTEIEQLQKLLADRRVDTAAADLEARLAARRADLGRADVKAGAVMAVVAGLAAVLGQYALTLTGAAAIAAGTAAGLGALTVATAVSVVWPRLAWRVGGRLAAEADIGPDALVEAAWARAEHARLRLGDLATLVVGTTYAARAKYRRLRAALVGLGLTGAAAIAAALTAIGA